MYSGCKKEKYQLCSYGRVGTFSIIFTIILNMIKYWVHMENNGDTLLREALFVSKSLHENGK
jgi:hypothetical protein